MTRLILVVAALLSARLSAQGHATTFDVVSVKPNLSGATGSGTESRPDGTVDATNVTVRSIILRAYNKQEFQVWLAGPIGWAPNGSTCWRADRATATEAAIAGDAGRSLQTAGAHRDATAAGVFANGGTVTGGGLTMERIATTLANYGAERPVIDRTDIEGIFDFTLKWVNQPTNNAEDVSLSTAVQEQLGLKLEPATAPVEVLVIDRVERPDPN